MSNIIYIIGLVVVVIAVQLLWPSLKRPGVRALWPTIRSAARSRRRIVPGADVLPAQLLRPNIALDVGNALTIGAHRLRQLVERDLEDFDPLPDLIFVAEIEYVVRRCRWRVFLRSM